MILEEATNLKIEYFNAGSKFLKMVNVKVYFLKSNLRMYVSDHTKKLQKLQMTILAQFDLKLNFLCFSQKTTF